MLNFQVDLIDIELRSMKTVELRKLAASGGLKGQSSARKEHLLGLLEPIQLAQVENMEKVAAQRKAAEAAKVEAPAAPKTNLCPICELRRKYTGAANGEKAPRLSDMCNPCFAEGGWENTHSDSNHDAILETPEADRTEAQKLEIDGCWICFPELNLAKAAPKAGRSRAGMVIVAQGTEIHKSETFRKAAEGLGWTVTIETQTYEDGDASNTRHYATATKGQESISLAWDGRAYDYANSSARLNGRDRKVRNLKEALRLL